MTSQYIITEGDVAKLEYHNPYGWGADIAERCRSRPYNPQSDGCNLNPTCEGCNSQPSFVCVNSVNPQAGIVHQSGSSVVRRKCDPKEIEQIKQQEREKMMCELETWLVSELQESQNMLDTTIFEDDIFEHEIRCEIKDYSRILKKIEELRSKGGG